MRFTSSSNLSLLALFALLLGSCGVPLRLAIHDLASIHNPEDWSPRSPAELHAAPSAYLTGGGKLKTPQVFHIEDHQALEHAILDRLATAPPLDPGPALETASWLLLHLRFDPHTPSRTHALGILTSLVGYWVHQEGAHLLSSHPEGDLVQALNSLANAQDRASFRAGVLLLNHAQIPDGLTASEALIGLGRRAHQWKLSPEDRTLVFCYALRTVLLCFEELTLDTDKELAREAAASLEVILPDVQSPL